MSKKKASTQEQLTGELSQAFNGKKVTGVRVVDRPIPGSRYRHIIVIWEKWGSISQQDRGRIILDAFKDAHPDEPWRDLEITLALGLTNIEAQKLNVKAA